MGEPERQHLDDPPPGPRSAGEPDLLARLRQEPAQAIGDVVTRFERPLLKYARSIVGRGDAAQDVVQEAFVRLLGKVRSVQDLSAWLGRVTHNLAIDHLRREARMRKLHNAAAAERLPSQEPAEPSSMTPALERELRRLGVNERAVIVLKVIEGKSYKEISTLTGLSPSNVGYLIHHGLKKLAAQLEAAKAVEGGGR